MIEVITKGVKDNVIALSAHGKVTHEDYEQIVNPAVDEKIKAHGRVRLIYHLGSDVTGFEMEAIWDDARTGMQHFTGFEKIAVVTDISWIKDAVKIFGIFKPCPVRVFPNAALADATLWINE